MIASPPAPVLDWQDLVESLSMLELEELLLELGYKQAGEIKRQYQVNEMGLRRAKYRVKEKNQAKIADRCVNILAKWDYNIVVG